MSAPPRYINQIMIAAAGLEPAEFERDRPAIAGGGAIRQALATGLTHAGLRAGLPEREARRLAEAPAGGSDFLDDRSSPARSAPVHEASLIDLQPSRMSGMRHGEGRAFIDLAQGATGGPDVTA